MGEAKYRPMGGIPIPTPTVQPPMRPGHGAVGALGEWTLQAPHPEVFDRPATPAAQALCNLTKSSIASHRPSTAVYFGETTRHRH